MNTNSGMSNPQQWDKPIEARVGPYWYPARVEKVYPAVSRVIVMVAIPDFKAPYPVAVNWPISYEVRPRKMKKVKKHGTVAIERVPHGRKKTHMTSRMYPSQKHLPGHFKHSRYFILDFDYEEEVPDDQ